MRLGEQEFEVTSGLKAAPGLDEGVWRVCNDYRIEKLPERHIVPCGDRWEDTKPLEVRGLMIELALLEEEARKRQDFDEPIIRFVRKRGLLGLSGRVWYGKPLPRAPLETVRGYVTEIMRAAAIVRLYEAVLNEDEGAAAELLRHYPSQARAVAPDEGVEWPEDEPLPVERLGEDDQWYKMSPLEHALVEVTELVTQRVNELCYVTAIPPKRSHDVSKIRTGWAFKSLIGAAYLEMYWHIAAQGKITRCEYCGELIPGARANQRFCDDSCRNKEDNHSGRRAERARRKRLQEGTR